MGKSDKMERHFTEEQIEKTAEKFADRIVKAAEPAINAGVDHVEAVVDAMLQGGQGAPTPQEVKDMVAQDLNPEGKAAVDTVMATLNTERIAGVNTPPSAKTDWVVNAYLTEPGLYLYKERGEAVRLVEVSYDLKNVYAIRNDQMSGSIHKFSGMFNLVMPFPQIPL